MPLSEKFTLMSVGYTMQAIHALSVQKLPLQANVVPALFLVAPLLTGSTFCIGTILGKAGKRALGD